MEDAHRRFGAEFPGNRRVDACCIARHLGNRMPVLQMSFAAPVIALVVQEQVEVAEQMAPERIVAIHCEAVAVAQDEPRTTLPAISSYRNPGTV